MLAGPCWAVLVKTAYGRGVLHCVHHHGSKWVGRTYAAQPAVTNNPSFRALPCASQPAGPGASGRLPTRQRQQHPALDGKVA